MGENIVSESERLITLHNAASRKESPGTDRFYKLESIDDKESLEHAEFQERLRALLGIHD